MSNCATFTRVTIAASTSLIAITLTSAFAKLPFDSQSQVNRISGEKVVCKPGAFHFTAPIVSPRTRWRWTSNAKITRGTAATRPAAAISP
jgi:hypothetical protein